MSKHQSYPSVMYGPPEMLFEEKFKAEQELRRIFVVAAIFVKESPDPDPTQHSQTAPDPTQHYKILACQRGYGKWDGWWEFPGGKIEPGESDEEALRREIHEEMETDIEILRYYDTIDYRYDDFFMTLHLYLCKLPSDQFVLNDHSDARWLAHDQLTSVRWLPADIELVTRWTRSGFDF